MKYIKYLSFGIAVMLASACTKLEESFNDSLDFESDNITAAGLLRGAYDSYNGPLATQDNWWGVQSHSTDETIGPTRGGDWDDNGIWRVLHTQTWNADHIYIRAAFVGMLQIQFAATSVLEKDPTPMQAAEARFLRAYSMFVVLDGWNQVPYRENLQNLKELPETKTGVDAANFLISELETILPDLPEGPGGDVRAWRATKDAARALLVKLYLNKGTFANRAAPTFDVADMNKAIEYSDQIINSGRYSLTPNYYDNFSPENINKSRELIFVIEHTNGERGGNNAFYWFVGLHYNQRPSGWNGFTTLSDFYDKFDASDKRRGDTYAGVTDVSGLRVGFLVGQQYDQNGVALKDRGGNPLSFTREVKLRETGSNLEVTGIRVMKYPPDYLHEGPAENEVVLLRYADVLLMKAEAILRGGTATGGATPLSIVNNVRARASAPALSSVDLNVLLDERGRELYWEFWRRNDLIRFGKFLDAWQEKPATTPDKLLFPIPNQQLAVNPNLTQNPGY